MSAQPGRGQLDGGWWPQSRDLCAELADLVDHFPAGAGGVVCALYSPPDWEPAPRRIPVARGYVKVGCFPRDDMHLILLKMASHATLRVLVIPPDLSPDQGQEAMLAAASPGYAHSAASLLETVTDHPDVNPDDFWIDDGGAPAPAGSGTPSRRPKA